MENCERNRKVYLKKIYDMVTKSMQEVRGQGQHKQENWKTWQQHRCVCGNKYNNKSVNESEKNSRK